MDKQQEPISLESPTDLLSVIRSIDTDDRVTRAEDLDGYTLTAAGRRLAIGEVEGGFATAEHILNSDGDWKLIAHDDGKSRMDAESILTRWYDTTMAALDELDELG